MGMIKVSQGRGNVEFLRDSPGQVNADACCDNRFSDLILGHETKRYRAVCFPR